MTAAAAPQSGRSLWTDARARLVRNRAAVASFVLLGLVTLASLFGPLLTGHPHDKVYTDYVRVGPSLTAYPKRRAVACRRSPASQRASAPRPRSSRPTTRRASWH